MSSQNPSGDTTTPSAAAPVQTITYICGECRAESQIKPRENIRCHDCGHRVLYKKRSDMLSVFEAR
ncbi:DNA-directed RNA polymerases I, II, and III subunit RPABC4 [Hymenolepis weldensis]